MFKDDLSPPPPPAENSAWSPRPPVLVRSSSSVEHPGTKDLRSVPQENKKLSWCWQTCATHLEVSQGHQTWYHSIC